MATETKKESASQDASHIAVGDGGKHISYRQKFKRLARQAAFLIIMLAVLAVAGILIRNVLHGSGVYAQAAGHKIYKSDVQKIKGGNKSINDHDAATVLADMYLSQAMAKQNSVQVSQADIAAASCPDQKANPYGYQNCLNEVYFTKLSDNNEGLYTGKFLVANFSRYVPYESPLLDEQKKLNPKIGDKAAIAADKAYAQQFITNLYNQIKAGKISFDQAIAMEHNDPVVGEKAYPSQAHSGAFNGRLSQINLLSAMSIRQKLRNIKPGETTMPFAVPVSASSSNGSLQDAYYLVVKMDNVSGGHGKVDFQQELQQAKKKLGYKVNV